MIKLKKNPKKKKIEIEVEKLERAFKGEREKHIAERQEEYEQIVKEYALFLAEDCDWDFASLIDMMIYKISRMKKLMLSNQRHTDADKTTAQMQEVIDLLQRVNDDDYEEEVFKDFHDKYGQPQMVSIDDGSGQTSIPVKFIYNNGREATDEMVTEQRKLYQIAEKKKHADLKKAMLLMSKNILGWWE